LATFDYQVLWRETNQRLFLAFTFFTSTHTHKNKQTLPRKLCPTAVAGIPAGGSTMLKLATPGPVKAAAIVLVISLVFGVTPWRLIHFAYQAPCFMLSPFIAVGPAAPGTLKAAVQNVTTDFSELSSIIQDFLHSPAVDPSVETAFRAYLAQRAQRSHRGLESALDWLLAVYKFAFPFVVLSLITKVTASATKDRQHERDMHASRAHDVPLKQVQDHAVVPAFVGPSGRLRSKTHDIGGEQIFGPETPLAEGAGVRSSLGT
jgi:hypothetical protein